MTNVTGTSYQSVNIRSAPRVVNSPYNGIGSLKKGDTFTGATVFNGLDKWIELKTLNDAPAVGFVASWVVDYKEIADPSPEPSPADVNADVHVTIRDGVVLGVNVDGEAWTKQ